MSITIYLKIPKITGDITEKTHAQWIKADAIRFNASRNICSEPGNMANRESTRPTLSEVGIYKSLDSASSLLFGEACTGQTIHEEEVIIDCCKTGALGMKKIAQFRLQDVIISSYELTSNNSTSLLDEKITLSYAKIEMTAFPHAADGSDTTPVRYGYDLRTATSI
jgi:type VI secretion system secreted protein Hcp